MFSNANIPLMAKVGRILNTRYMAVPFPEPHNASIFTTLPILEYEWKLEAGTSEAQGTTCSKSLS
jgi:hypothetical protein